MAAAFGALSSTCLRFRHRLGRCLERTVPSAALCGPRAMKAVAIAAKGAGIMMNDGLIAHPVLVDIIATHEHLHPLR